MNTNLLASQSFDTASSLAVNYPANITIVDPAAQSSTIELLNNRSSDIHVESKPNFYNFLTDQGKKQFNTLWELIQSHKTGTRFMTDNGSKIFILQSPLNLNQLTFTNNDHPNLTEFFKEQNISLSHAYMPEIKLNGANLNGVNLNGANLDKVDLTVAKLNGAEINNASLIEAKLAGVELNNAQINNSKLNGANLYYAQLKDTQLNNAQLNGAIFDYAQLKDTQLNNAQLNNAMFYESTNLNGALLNNIQAETIYIDNKSYDVKTQKEFIKQWFESKGATISFAKAA